MKPTATVVNCSIYVELGIYVSKMMRKRWLVEVESFCGFLWTRGAYKLTKSISMKSLNKTKR